VTDGEGSFDQLTVAEALERATAGVMLVDVSEQWEWDRGHAPTAVHMPMSSLGARLDELPVDEDVLIMCQSGIRSFSIATTLADRGFRAIDVLGGMAAWREAGLPVEVPAEHDPTS
jgi:rhodanese-related sulfurtransferase